MRITYWVLVIASFTLTSCANSHLIEGLWVVDKVIVGEEEMTPNAKWTRFNSDNTQESGNGRFQHSYGTWDLDLDGHSLKIINQNGLEDGYPPFSIKIDADQMIWERKEDGQDLKVILTRSSDLPETYGDQILGLWQLEDAFGVGNFFKATETLEPIDYIFFRWDKRFLINSQGKRISGVYNVHGHKPEVELIPYGDSVNREFWKIDFEQDTILLTLLNTESQVTRKFSKIRRFPE